MERGLCSAECLQSQLWCRKLDWRKESELGEAGKFREKRILIFGGDGLGGINEFWCDEEYKNVCANIFALSDDGSS